ncbi:hypothetical protein K435DRAFT_860715, partial [Dendrothele bispora CBS 962.96]
IRDHAQDTHGHPDHAQDTHGHPDHAISSVAGSGDIVLHLKFTPYMDQINVAILHNKT